MSRKLLYIERMLPVVAAVLTALLAYFSPVAATGSDPQFGLLVAQTMLRHRTLEMDLYQEAIGPILERSFVTLNGHIYYYFPLGTPLFAMPAVGVANLLGYDMADAAQEAATQNFISAVLVGLSFYVIYRICRCFLPAGAALFITATTFLGSALISTMATALWSIDFAVLFVALSLLVLSKQATGERRPSHPYLLGFFLFGAYLCRPSTFLFVALVLGYLLLVDRKMFWRTAVSAFVLLAGFLIFIRLGYGSWLPPYYNDFGRLAVERRPLYEAYFGNLVSPSRGLLIYSPIFLLALAGAVYYFQRLKRRPLYWLMLVWFFLHLLLVARATRWWGGASFGPRILAEMLPGLVLLMAMVGQVFLERGSRGRPGSSRRPQTAVIGLYGALALWAVFLNSYQGLFNQYSAWWHGVLTLNIDYEPDYLWRWDYPQFLADNEMLCKRDREYIGRVMMSEHVVGKLVPYELERPLEMATDYSFLISKYLAEERRTAVEEERRTDFGPDATRVYLPAVVRSGDLAILLSGWGVPQAGHRLSLCETVTLAFKLDEGVEPERQYTLSLRSGSLGEQRVNVWLNGVDLGQVVFRGELAIPGVQLVMIPPGVLRPGAVNEVVLDLPDSRVPDLPDEERPVGLSFVSFDIGWEGKR